MLQVVSESRQITLQQPKYGRLEVSHMLQEVTYIFHNKIVHQICRAKINGGVYFQFVRVIPFSKSIRKLIWRNLAKHLASSRNPINESNDGLNYLASAQLSSTGRVSKQSAIEATILWTKSQKVIPINSFPTDSSPQKNEYPPYKLTDDPGPFSNCYVSVPEIIMTPFHPITGHQLHWFQPPHRIGRLHTLGTTILHLMTFDALRESHGHLPKNPLICSAVCGCRDFFCFGWEASKISPGFFSNKTPPGRINILRSHEEVDGEESWFS